MYNVIVGWHSGGERPFDGVESYSVSATPAELVLTGGSWQEVHIPLDGVRYWAASPAGT